ncbi:MAG: type I restriction enzyme HsdR N-terminal domain-containing protein [Bacteroidetes bacterium]|nr:type I restriction enzyme HsdR N-terminal domain-containing protein [Bacteroidota bacterium]MBS1973257.1 type I restriction enzyme HsdR N-terminal domain-containing protein [Bacteroidota bacterium]
MIKIYYPNHPFRIKEEEIGKEYIFDELRKQWVRLTPEEWVRQNFVRYLVDVKKYPASYIAIERKMKLNEMNKRFDILVFDDAAKPWMMVECKGMNIALDKTVLWQALNYNIAIPVKYLVITNGEYCYGYQKGLIDFEAMPALPAYGK